MNVDDIAVLADMSRIICCGGQDGADDEDENENRKVKRQKP